ncbi:type IV toxin-antitoxin system AbiEi family antitoxin domain-containing protein [Myceligenerans halotolerans]
MAGGRFLSIEETANALGVSTRHARRLADSGAITRVARGLIDNAVHPWHHHR